MVCYQLVSISYLITLQGDHSVRGFKRRWWSHKCSSRTEGFVNIVIYLPTKHLGALKNSFECLRAFQIERAYAVLSVCYIRWVFSAWIDNWRREETNSRCLSWKDVHLLDSQWRREGTNSVCLSKTGVHFVDGFYWSLRWKLANRVFKKMLWRWQSFGVGGEGKNVRQRHGFLENVWNLGILECISSIQEQILECLNGTQTSFKGHVRVSAHAHSSKCCFSVGTSSIFFSRNMIMS